MHYSCTLEYYDVVTLSLVTMPSRSSVHVKKNDTRLGLKIESRDLQTTLVNGLASVPFSHRFRWRGKSGSKRKARSTVKAWEAPLFKQHEHQWFLIVLVD